MEPRKCKHCGKIYTPTSGVQKYCSPYCAKQVEKLKARKGKKVSEAVKDYVDREGDRFKEAWGYQEKKICLSGKDQVTAEYDSIKITGRIIEEYDNFYLIDTGNYIESISKNSIICNDVAILSVK